VNIKTIVTRLLALRSNDIRRASDALERIRVVTAFKAHRNKLDAKEFEDATRELLSVVFGPDWEHATSETVRRIAMIDGYDESVAVIRLDHWGVNLHPSVGAIPDLTEEAMAVVTGA
jgi:hypothetical protein